MPRTIHVIGAGLSGLAAAVRLAERGERVIVHEQAGQAGGRCRSYEDPQLGITIDNGNHLLLSGNHAALSYLELIGAADRLIGPDRAEFAFMDLKSGERWMVRINDGIIPWWLFDANARPAGTSAMDFIKLAALAIPANKPIGEVINCSGPAYHRFLEPLMLAALNTDPKEGSAALAAHIIHETLMRGGKAVPSADRARRPEPCAGRAGARVSGSAQCRGPLRQAAARTRARGGKVRVSRFRR